LKTNIWNHLKIWHEWHAQNDLYICLICDHRAMGFYRHRQVHSHLLRRSTFSLLSCTPNWCEIHHNQMGIFLTHSNQICMSNHTRYFLLCLLAHSHLFFFVGILKKRSSYAPQTDLINLESIDQSKPVINELWPVSLVYCL